MKDLFRIKQFKVRKKTLNCGGGGGERRVYCGMFTYFIWKHEKKTNVKHMTVFIYPRHTILSEKFEFQVF